MAEIKEGRLQLLRAERCRLDETFAESIKLLDKEIDRIESGFETDKFIELHQNPAKVEFRVRLPVKEYPQANFVGRIVGPSGATIKDLQATSGVRIAVFGKGSIKDKAKEEELRKQGGKYAHLNHDLHVHLYATGNAVSCYKRIALAMELIEPLLSPDYREDVQAIRGPGDAFGIAPPRRSGMPMPAHRGLAGWPAQARGHPHMSRGRGANSRGNAPVRGAASARGATLTRGMANTRGTPRGRAASSAGTHRGAARGRGGGPGRGQARPAAVAGRLASSAMSQAKAEYPAAIDAYEYEATSAYADAGQSYLDPNSYGIADASDAYYDYGQGDTSAYDAYDGGWGEEAVETSGYGKVQGGRSVSSYRAHPY